MTQQRPRIGIRRNNDTGGFEGSFKDRAELIKTVKPDDPNFIKMREQMMTQRKYDREYLDDWTPKNRPQAN